MFLQTKNLTPFRGEISRLDSLKLGGIVMANFKESDGKKHWIVGLVGNFFCFFQSE